MHNHNGCTCLIISPSFDYISLTLLHAVLVLFWNTFIFTRAFQLPLWFAQTLLETGTNLTFGLNFIKELSFLLGILTFFHYCTICVGGKFPETFHNIKIIGCQVHRFWCKWLASCLYDTFASGCPLTRPVSLQLKVQFHLLPSRNFCSLSPWNLCKIFSSSWYYQGFCAVNFNWFGYFTISLLQFNISFTFLGMKEPGWLGPSFREAN